MKEKQSIKTTEKERPSNRTLNFEEALFDFSSHFETNTGRPSIGVLSFFKASNAKSWY